MYGNDAPFFFEYTSQEQYFSQTGKEEAGSNSVVYPLFLKAPSLILLRFQMGRTRQIAMFHSFIKQV